MRKPFRCAPAAAPQGLEYYYRERRSLADFRRGPLGPHFDGFAAALHREGYARRGAQCKLGVACQFNVFLMDRGIATLSGVSEALIDPFLDLYLTGVRTGSDRYNPRANARCDLKHLFRYLFASKLLAPSAVRPAVKPYSWLLEPYLQRLRDDHALVPLSIARTAKHLASFLETLLQRADRRYFYSLPPETVEAHLQRHLEDSRDNLLRLCSSLRRFFRYCALHNLTRTDLSGLVPPVRYYRHAAVPKGVDDFAVQRWLRSINQDTPTGARDYAIALLLVAYGIRGISAAQLRLEDIDWPHSRIRFRAQKGGKEVVVPLLEPVGQAIIQWLRHRFAASACREVFLTLVAPYRPLNTKSMSFLVQRAMAQGGFAPGSGARSLRHSWAIRALAHDSPIKAIADVLGHRYIDTTFIYAKVDFKTLSQVALPWPPTR